MSASNTGVEVIVRDLATNPKCPHGPTILFSSRAGKTNYFSCSCQRDTKCFYLRLEKFNEENQDEFSHKHKEQPRNLGINYSQVRNMPAASRIYCKTCEFFIESTSSHESHKFIRGISNEIIKEPSLFLPQLDDDKLNAQYFFDDKSLDFITSVLEDLKFHKIICIGAPRLHDYIRVKKLGLKSILLDIDQRYEAFNEPADFIHYNMFNNHFFNGQEDEKKLLHFLKDDDPTRARNCLLSDPPFGGRTELLTITIQTISLLYNRVNAHHKILPVMWIFPYFNECHIQKQMPQLEMLDFQVSYMNHRAYCDAYKGRKEGSPVRIFTNIDLKLVKYPSHFTNYRFCQPCKRFVFVNNRHCIVCKKCPSKNGAVYRHCEECMICVKPNYQHCSTCNRCVQKSDHNCKIYQQHQECWCCCQRGHVEKNCAFMKRFKNKKDGSCRVCKGKKKHHLKLCPSKSKIFNKFKNNNLV